MAFTNSVAGMGDEEKGGGYGPWSRVPQWDGSPATWRKFKREVMWWISSIDLTGTTKFNLAARFLLRQEGIARQRGEEFNPSELQYKAAELGLDPETGESIQLTEPDYLAGLNKLMAAWETMNGRTALDKRGELRQTFYMDLQRRPGERVTEFATRFRSLVADLRAEGVQLHDNELGWWLKQKLGLDALRKQLLDTALQGSEDYNVIETEVLRLFRDLHDNDPMKRRFEPSQKLTVRRMFGGRPASSAASSVGPSSYRSSSLMSLASHKSSPTGFRQGGNMKQANVTELDDAEVGEAPPEDEVEEAQSQPNLDEVLQAEAEILACELEEAENEGVDDEIIQNLESNIEAAAETLVTMREARQQLATVRKDRGYGKASTSSGGKGGGRKAQVEARKTSGKHPCFDCGLPGHWAGDAACTMPGAGAGRAKAASKKPAKQVRVAEATPQSMVHSAEVAEVSALPLHDVLVAESPTLDHGHEVMMVAGGSETLNLEQALAQNVSRSALVTGNETMLAQDKQLVGALDSACNRTCAGQVWVNNYLDALHRYAPPFVQSLIQCEDESENFRFGNNGVVPSIQRWRLPAMIGETLVLIWVSLVPIGTLGCLIGRDFLEAIGAMIDFTKRTLVCSTIASKMLHLKQMAAGHFMLQMLPPSQQWGRPPQNRWRRIGQDGIVELQMSRKAWARRCLTDKSKKVETCESGHEHQLAESWINETMNVNHHASPSASGLQVVQEQFEDPRDCDPRSHVRRLRDIGLQSSPNPMEKVAHSSRRSFQVVNKGGHAVAIAATILAISAIPLSFGVFLQGLDGTDSLDGRARYLASTTPTIGNPQVDSFSSWGVCAPSQPRGIQDSLHRGRAVFLDAWNGEKFQRTKGCDSKGSHGRDSGESSKGSRAKQSRRDGPSDGWAKGRTARIEGRSDSIGDVAERSGGFQRDRPTAQGQDQGATRNDEGWITGSFVLNKQGGRIFEVQSCEKECYASTAAGRRIDGASSSIAQRSTATGRHGSSTSNGGRADDVRGDGSNQPRVIDGAGSDPLRSPPWNGHRLSKPASDGSGRMASLNVEDASHAASSSSGLASGANPCPRDRWCVNLGDGIDGEQAAGDTRASNGFALRPTARPMKAGIAQMISQAWSRHCRDREAVSKNRFEVLAVLMEQWNGEVRNSMNEVFVTEVQGPNLFVTEVYTDTEPIAKEAVRRGLRAGSSLTLASGWDFRDETARRKAIKELDDTDPYLTILAFPCNVWSMLMNLNPSVDIEVLREAARVLVQFAIEVAEHRLKRNRHFLMENPLGSAAWKLPEMERFLQHPMVRSVLIDQCAFGLRDAAGNLHKKPTRLVTSMQALVSRLVGMRCDKSHQHAHVMGGSKITKPAGHYPLKLCHEIVAGALDQFDFETRVMMSQATEQGSENSTEVLAAEAILDGGAHRDDEASGSDDSLGDIDVPSNKIPSSIKAAVRRLHVNTGHRSNKRLARALVLCGAPKEAVVAAKTLKCDVCDERKQPKTRRPATLPSVKDVGAQAHIDLLVVEDAFKQSFYVVHVTDKVSRYQLAALVPNKSSAEVTKFLSTMWLPLLGAPQILVADQGREFISREFEEWCGMHSIYLHHIGVQCPWQNGIAERSGATLKAIIGALVRTYSLGGADDMQRAVAEAAAAYNADVNEEGVSPLQAVTGRQPPAHGDVLNGLSNRLTEHSLIENKPSLARQVALRETARVAMVRLHFSRGFRKAELARARTTSLQDFPQPGDLCYFWRESKYNPRKKGQAAGSRKRLQLKRWFGPALMVAGESGLDGEEGANCFLSFRGQLTKCGKEHVRKASSLEQISYDAWEEAIRDVIAAADVDKTIDREVVPLTPAPDAMSDSELEELFEAPPQVGFAAAATAPQVADTVGDMIPLTPQELVAAISPSEATPLSSRVPSRRQSVEVAPSSRRASATSMPEVVSLSDEAPPREPVHLLQGAIDRARSLERTSEARGEKRAASRELVREEVSDGAPPPDSSGASPAFEALTMSWDQVCKLAVPDEATHPLLQVQAQAEAERRTPLDCVEGDHGSWDGRWSFLCERDWKLMQEMGQQWPSGSSTDFETYNVQASRKEYHWKGMSTEDRKGFSEAAVKGWLVYVENGAVEVLDMKQSKQIQQRLSESKETSKIMKPRFVMTDKNDGLRTENRWLPKKHSSRLVVPGYKDKLNLEGRLRRDAPTGSRLSQHLLFCVAAWNRDWSLLSGDIKSAFMKGDIFADETRELYLCPTDPTTGPSIPLQQGQLARVKKAVFGLADAPREWWLRLSRSLGEHHWMRTLIDGATWLLWDKSLKLEERSATNLKGIIVAHVDDLLFVGDPDAVKSFDSIGDELGFGSRESNDFTWCGKRIRRAEDRTIRLSMLEYHTNLKEIFLTKQRKADMTAELTPFETRQLRALLGSFQWLVAQLRFDMAFGVSSLQGEKPTVNTILRSNQLLKQFQMDCNFELIFRPIDLAKCGIMVVSDAALGNVTLEGSTDAAVASKVYSQACYFVLVADPSLMSGQSGFFNILDARSHRISRVCRSTYAAETLAAEEAFDIGQLCRGFIATTRGYNMVGKSADKAVDMIDLSIIVDAKDVFDKTNSDTTTYGAQKSMAFTVAWMRSQLRRPRTSLKWTSTENMWADGGTKQMDLSHMRRIMKAGQWSVSYCPSFVKQVYKAAKSSKQQVTATTLPGEPLTGSDPLLNHLLRLGNQRGWHFQNNVGVHVAFGAKSFRTPEPRFSMEAYPIRSSFARFSLPSGQMEWRQLERGIRYGRLSNQHALFGGTAGVLVTLFHADDGVSLE